MADDVTRLFDRSHVTRVASAAEIAAAEAEIGALPPSYKAFAEAFGYGTTNGLFVFEMPFSMAGLDGLRIRGAAIHEQVHALVDEYREEGVQIGGPDCLEPCDDESGDVARFFDDLRFYGSSIDGHYLCWRGPVAGSFRFYVIDRACFSIRFAGDSLIDFIRKTQTDEVKRLLGAGYGRLPRRFEGATVAG